MGTSQRKGFNRRRHMSNNSTTPTEGTTKVLDMTLDEDSKSLYAAGPTNFEPTEGVGSHSSDNARESQDVTAWEDVVQILRL